MTKSEFFKAAHKMAKAYKQSLGGDYVVYLAYAMKTMVRLSSKWSKEKIFANMNSAIKKHGGSDLMMREVKENQTRGLKTFSHEYKLEKSRKDLAKGEFFGKVFVNAAGEYCAWVNAVVVKTVAY